MESKGSLIGRLFGGLWSAVVTLYKVVIVLSLLLFVFGLWLVWSGPGAPKIEDNVALIVAPSGVLVDQLEIDPTRAFLDQLAGAPPPQTALADVTEAFEKAADDPRIPFAVLKLDGLWGAGLAQINELVAAMQTFQAAGKRVIAYSAWYDQIGYLAASRADEIVMDPLGVVAVEGLSAYTQFFKGLTDKLGIEMNVFRVGEYKSAVEPFLRTDMSDEAKAANLDWLGDLWSSYTVAVADGRGLDAAQVVNYVEQMPQLMRAENGNGAAAAQTAALVTHLETLREFRARMAETVGVDEQHGSFRQIHFQSYLAARAREPQASESENRIARVVVQGEIVDGASDIGVAGGDTISELLDEARRDDTVRAVLLRVNSPGGSVWASEQIRRAVVHLQDEGKPVVVSMGNLAASGGYWVSANADRIFAHPETITGSIGIFGLLPTFDQTLAKAGITTDGVGTTSLAGGLRFGRPLSEPMRQIIQMEIERGYRDFITLVAEAREQPVEAIDTIARGRVWSGAAALAHGLVDRHGSEAEAVAALAELAGLEAWTVVDFAPQTDPFQRLLAQLTGGLAGWLGSAVLPSWLQSLLPPAAAALDPLARWNDPRGHYAHCQCAVNLGGTLRR